MRAINFNLILLILSSTAFVALVFEMSTVTALYLVQGEKNTNAQYIVQNAVIIYFNLALSSSFLGILWVYFTIVKNDILFVQVIETNYDSPKSSDRSASLNTYQASEEDLSHMFEHDMSLTEEERNLQRTILKTLMKGTRGSYKHNMNLYDSQNDYKIPEFSILQDS